MINAKLASLAVNNLMPDPAFRTIPHFEVGMAPGYPFVAKMPRVRELIPVQFSQDFLFFPGSFLHALVEFKLRRMPDFCFVEFGGGSPSGSIMRLLSTGSQ